MRLIYSIDVPYACFGLIAEGDSEKRAIVVESPPIAKWCTGKSLRSVLNYWRDKNAKIILASKKANPMAERLFSGDIDNLDHVSVSRIQKFLQCKLSYKFSYLDKKRPPKSDILNFGTWVHACFESIYKWVLLEEHVGRVPHETISRLCAIEMAKIGGLDQETYQEGMELVTDYFKLNVDIDHNRVIAVEKTFELELASGIKLVGVIDRIERDEDGQVLVIDYKTNRSVYVEDELEDNLQMLTYGLAVKTLWPNVKDIKYRFDLLRHCKEQVSLKTTEDTQQAYDYLSAMSIAIRDAEEFPAKINQFCPWCDHRDYCDEFQVLLKKDPEKLEYSEDIKSICNAREQVSAMERDAKRKRQELERQIRAYMKKQDIDKLDVDGNRYLNHHNEDEYYEFEKTQEVLENIVKFNTSSVLGEIARVAPKDLMELVESLDIERTKKARLRFDLERSVIKKRKGSPYLMVVKAR